MLDLLSCRPVFKQWAAIFYSLLGNRNVAPVARGPRAACPHLLHSKNPIPGTYLKNILSLIVHNIIKAGINHFTRHLSTFIENFIQCISLQLSYKLNHRLNQNNKIKITLKHAKNSGIPKCLATLVVRSCEDRSHISAPEMILSMAGNPELDLHQIDLTQIETNQMCSMYFCYSINLT